MCQRISAPTPRRNSHQWLKGIVDKCPSSFTPGGISLCGVLGLGAGHLCAQRWLTRPCRVYLLSSLPCPTSRSLAGILWDHLPRRQFAPKSVSLCLLLGQAKLRQLWIEFLSDSGYFFWKPMHGKHKMTSSGMTVSPLQWALLSVSTIWEEAEVGRNWVGFLGMKIQRKVSAGPAGWGFKELPQWGYREMAGLACRGAS